MSETTCQPRRPVDAGDVYTMNTDHAAFVMLVMSKDEVVLDTKHGAKVYFRWLAHPDPTKVTVCEWIHENTLQVANAWTLIASAD